MPDKARDQFKKILEQRDRTADVGALADAGLSEFGGADKIMRELRLLVDDERTQIPVKARIYEVILDLVKEASKDRVSSHPADGLSDEDLLKVAKGLVVELGISE